MPKKCIICGNEAIFCIKDSRDYYCEDCAKESFSDLDCLQKVEEQARALKEIVEKKSE